jgi:NADH:ubiquinone oxidoreductase subunit F (NADH-binding)
MIHQLLTKRFGNTAPSSIKQYLADGGYQSFEKTLNLTNDQIITEIKNSQLIGRGGAGYPTGLKMESVYLAEGFPKYMICNADEGEPGNFKDRYLMENDPHQLIEGMLICAYAINCQHGYIFIRGEYAKSIATMKEALEQARNKGYLGDNILDTGFDFDIEIKTGAGSYVCGEEFALLISIEGKAGRVTYKPPFPTTNGLFDKPTQINNVETFCNIPHILSMGANAYAAIGSKTSKGTKLISLSGNVNKPGLYEVEFGTTIKSIIDDLGHGVPNKRKIKMVQLGGASGPIIPASMLDLKIDKAVLRANNLTIGSGAIIVMDDRIDVLDFLKRTITFFHHESCGKCTPCREGLTHLLIIINKFIDKKATIKDYELLKILIETIKETSICGLGQAAPTAVSHAIIHFNDEFLSHINREVK